MSKNLTKLSNNTDLTFKKNLLKYKTLIDSDIASYSKELESTTFEQFGEHSLLATKLFTDILSRGGKRIRGSLTMISYYMNGGTDDDVAIKAARAVEVMQAYLLIIDDICDRSHTRRGGPTAHIMAKNWHEENYLKDDSAHFGEAIAAVAGCLAMHLAIDTILQLNVSPSIKNAAINNANTNLIITAHGQFNDIYNGVTQTTDHQSIENVLVWKTAYYTFVNPLQFGAVLAGVDDKRLDVLAEYALQVGRAFQITDDILGTFGNEFESGKSPLDDIKEGKRTILVTNAIENAAKSDAYFLESCLGNQNLTTVEFEKCKDIISSSGALEYAKKEANISGNAAFKVLKSQKYWDASATRFLTSLVQYILERKS